MDVLAGATSRTEPRITAAAERHGLLGGFRKAKRERILIQCAGFWIAAGATLYWAPAQP